MALLYKCCQLQPEDAEIRSAVRSLTLQQNALFAAVLARVQAGMTTAEVAALARTEAARQGLALSFKSAMGFPDDVSVSVGKVVINGIPDATPIRDGDIVRMALGTHDRGRAFSVQNWSVCIGHANSSARELLAAVHAGLREAAALCRPGVRFSRLAEALQASSELLGFYLSADFAGHPIGSRPVMEPNIVAPRGLVKHDAELAPGVFLSFFALGHASKTQLAPSGNWAVRDRHGVPAAVFSHLVEVSEDGPRILTAEHPLELPASAQPPG